MKKRGNLEYDPMGNRVYKASSASGNRKYIIDISGELPTILLELDPNSGMEIKKTYIYADSQILAQHNGSYNADRFFYLHDRLGSVRLVINSSGDVNNTYTYKPFGEMFPTEFSETVSNPFKFSGQFFDDETGQYYLRNRQYEPILMRFASRDPAFGKFEQPMSFHKYLYCFNNPINLIDPWGLISIAFYDGLDDGKTWGSATGAQFKEAANNYDVYYNFHSFAEIEMYLWFEKDVIGSTIDDVYIFDHGVGEKDNENFWGRQQVGDEMLEIDNPLLQQAGSYLEESGTFHLMGCGVAAYDAGKGYLKSLARMTGRDVEAYDKNITYRRSWQWWKDDWTTEGILWQASKGGGSVTEVGRGG